MYFIVTIIGVIFIIINVIVFGIMYLAANKQGFIVPTCYISPEKILNLSLDEKINYSDKYIENINEKEKIEGIHEGKTMMISVNSQPVYVSIIYWEEPTNAIQFWKMYRSNIRKKYGRRKEFRNNIWYPKFIVGLFGKSTGYNISAWHQDNWFFVVAVSTQINDHIKIKATLKNMLLENIKFLCK